VPAKPSQNRNLSAADLALCIGLSENALRKYWLRFVPPSAIVAVGSGKRYQYEAVVAIWREKLRRDVELARESASDPDAALLAGENTPAKERYVAAKAGLAELELAEKRGKVVAIADLQPMLDDGAFAIRAALETIERRGFQEAADLMVDAIRRWESAIPRVGVNGRDVRHTGAPDGADDRAPDAPSEDADDGEVRGG